MPFLWQSDRQPPARWHGEGDGPANYFADTPVGAWAEFLRHEGITDVADLAGVRRSLWVVELPDDGYAKPSLPPRTLSGGLGSYAACQVEARRLREAGAQRLEAPAAALKAGTARGWTAMPEQAPAPLPRNGKVWVVFGPCEAVGWPAVVAGAPPAEVLPLVRHS
ncbi:MAG TPA: RES domain-containing protein [Burkholderiaceae bacterium]|nr:RES domain-containing protein [Burkholderiaceae bacterium]